MNGASTLSYGIPSLMTHSPHGASAYIESGSLSPRRRVSKKTPPDCVFTMSLTPSLVHSSPKAWMRRKSLVSRGSRSVPDASSVLTFRSRCAQPTTAVRNACRSWRKAAPKPASPAAASIGAIHPSPFTSHYRCVVALEGADLALPAHRGAYALGCGADGRYRR